MKKSEVNVCQVIFAGSEASGELTESQLEKSQSLFPAVREIIKNGKAKNCPWGLIESVNTETGQEMEPPLIVGLKMKEMIMSFKAIKKTALESGTNVEKAFTKMTLWDVCHISLEQLLILAMDANSKGAVPELNKERLIELKKVRDVLSSFLSEFIAIAKEREEEFQGAFRKGQDGEQSTDKEVDQEGEVRV